MVNSSDALPGSIAILAAYSKLDPAYSDRRSPGAVSRQPPGSQFRSTGWFGGGGGGGNRSNRSIIVVAKCGPVSAVLCLVTADYDRFVPLSCS